MERADSADVAQTSGYGRPTRFTQIILEESLWTESESKGEGRGRTDMGDVQSEDLIWTFREVVTVTDADLAVTPLLPWTFDIAR